MKTQLVDRFDDSVIERSRGNRNFAQSREHELVAKARSGSVFAFEQLVDDYAPKVFRVAQSVAYNRADAEEIMQDAFVEAFENLHQFRGDSRFCTWLLSITINAGRVKLRRDSDISIDTPFKNENGAASRESRIAGLPSNSITRRRNHQPRCCGTAG